MTVERVSYLHESEIDEFMNDIQHALQPGVDRDALSATSCCTCAK